PPSTGTYVLASGITLPDNVHLVGRGKGVTLQSRVTSGATITMGNYTRAAHFRLLGSRSVTLTPIGLLASAVQEVLLEFLKIDEFTTAGIRFFEAQSSMLLQCEVFHIIAADGTAHGVDFEDGFNNGNQVIGGEIHSCSNGVYIGAGAVQNSVCT